MKEFVGVLCLQDWENKILKCECVRAPHLVPSLTFAHGSPAGIHTVSDEALCVRSAAAKRHQKLRLHALRVSNTQITQIEVCPKFKFLCKCGGAQ